MQAESTSVPPNDGNQEGRTGFSSLSPAKMNSDLTRQISNKPFFAGQEKKIGIFTTRDS